MILATGINASMVRLTFQWTFEMNYVRLAFAWVMFILMAVMIVVTVRTMIKNPKRNDIAAKFIKKFYHFKKSSPLISPVMWYYVCDKVKKCLLPLKGMNYFSILKRYKS